MAVQPERDTLSAPQSFLREVKQLTLGASQASEPDRLADMICQVPLVRELLPRESRKAVQSCSRQCRSLMHHLMTAIVVNTPDDLKAISSSTWPSLGLVAIRKQSMDPAAMDAIAQCKLQVLAVFGLRHAEVRGEFVALVLKPSTEQQCPDLTVDERLQSLFRIMHAIKPWGQYRSWDCNMRHLTLQQSQLSSASLTQLFSLSWYRLLYLDLSKITLDTAAVVALGKSRCPRLIDLYLSCSTLQTSTAQLTQRHWPGVQFLTLRGPSSTVSDTTLSAFVASWPRIRQLNLEDVQIGADFGAVLARTHSGLDTLYLLSVPLDAKRLRGFMLASWSLERVVLQNNGLGSDAIAVLTRCSFPQLDFLCLSHNQLDESAARYLVTSVWPELDYLDVSHNALGNRAMQALAKGRWPKLEWLELQGNAIDAVGVAALVKGRWPEMRFLQLDHTAVSAATWALLTLDPAFLSHHEDYYEVPRLFTDASKKSLIWDDMSHVAFGEGHFDV